VQKAAKDSPLAMRSIKSNSLKSFRFPSKDSYSTVASKGKRAKFGFLSLKILQSPDDCSRFCFIVKKKNGCAVFRNRCRRVLRHIFFNEAKNFKMPLWIMAIVDMNRANADWKALRACGEEAVKELGRSHFCKRVGNGVFAKQKG